MRLRHVKNPDYCYDRLPGHCGDSTILTYQDNEYVLGRGDDDWFEVYRDLDDLYGVWIVSGSPELGYLGVEYCNPYYSEKEPRTEYLRPESIFLQDPDDAWSGYPQPKPWAEYQAYTIIRKLSVMIGG